MLQLRRGILEIITDDIEPEEYDLEVTVTEKVWRAILANDKSAAVAFMRGEFKVLPKVQKLIKFMSVFERE